MATFLYNLGLFLLRLVTGSLVSYFAAREMANRSDIIFQTLEFFSIGAADIVKVFIGCLVLILGMMLVIGFWTRFIAIVLLVLLAIGGYCWQPQASQLNFQVEALYGVLFFYLFLVGGGRWAVSRKRSLKGQSVLDSEQSILSSDSRPSIFNEDENKEEAGESILIPPVTHKDEETAEIAENEVDEEDIIDEEEASEEDPDSKERI